MRNLSVLVAVAALAAIVATPSWALMSLDDDFSDYGPATSLNASATDFNNVWEPVDGSVDLLTPETATNLNLAGACSPPGSTCVDLDGTTENAATFRTVELFEPGPYNLSFLLTGNRRTDAPDPFEEVTVTLGDFTKTYMLDTNDVVDAMVLANVGARRSRLSFAHAGGDNFGAILNSVSVTLVPLPAALPLLATGLGGLVWMRRRAA